MLLDTVGSVPLDGLEQWMLLRYQTLPALNGAADQVNGLQLPEWGTERGFVSDFLTRAGDQLDPGQALQHLLPRAQRPRQEHAGQRAAGRVVPARGVPRARDRRRYARALMRDRPPVAELRAQGTTPDMAQVRVDYFDEAGFISEVLTEYYRRLTGLAGINLPLPQILDNGALNAARNAKNKLRDSPESAANAATLEGLIDVVPARARRPAPRALADL